MEISELVIAIVAICLLLWRMSYGANNGLFAEAAGLIAVLASFAAVYYIIKIAGDILNKNLGNVIPKIGYLVVAFLIYRVMNVLAEQLRKVKEIPILGGMDRLLGTILGMIEALVIIYLITFITGIQIFPVLEALFIRLVKYIKSISF